MLSHVLWKVCNALPHSTWRAYLTHGTDDMPEEATHDSHDDHEHDPHHLDDESDTDDDDAATYTAPVKGEVKPTHSRYDLKTLRPHELLYVD